MADELKCSVCGETKPVHDFAKDRTATNRGGYSYKCTPCNSAKARAWYRANPEQAAATRRLHRQGNRDQYRRNALSVKYGLAVEEYERLLAAQSGVCAVCAGPEPIEGRSLAVDHCHTTGRVRGLLCSNCNRGIGLLGDTAERLRAALAYLEK